MIFLHDDSEDELKKTLERLYDRSEEYQKMKAVALEKAMNVFSYKKISERAIS